MHFTRFDASVVLNHRDIERSGNHVDPTVVMDVVEHAIAAVPGAEAIEICYIGMRDGGRRRVRLNPHGANSHPCTAGDWNTPLRLKVEKIAGRAIAAFARQAA